MIIIPLIVGLINFKYLSKSLKYILVLVFIGTISNLLSIALVLLNKKSVFHLHIYTLIEFLLISCFYYHISTKDFFKKMIKLIVGIFILTMVLNKIFLEQFDRIDNYTLIVESILVLIMASLYLTSFFEENLIIDFADYRFLLTVGYMIYFGGNLFIFALSNEYKVWLIHNLFSLLLKVNYTFVFLWQRYRLKFGG